MKEGLVHYFYIRLTKADYMNARKSFAFSLFFISICSLIHSQDTSGLEILTSFPEKIVQKVTKRVSDLDDKLIAITDKSLKRMHRREQRVKRKLRSIDSVAVKEIFGGTEEYDNILSGLKENKLSNKNNVGEYFYCLDSLKTNLKFLKHYVKLNNISSKVDKNVSEALTSLGSLQERMKNISSVQKFLKQRRHFLSSQLAKYGFEKDLKGINKEVYYYTVKIKEYKSLLNDPKRLELVAFRLLNKIPSFKDFFEKNSFIASVFGPSSFPSFANQASAISDIPGLQSRAEVDRIISTDFLNNSAASGNPSDILREKLSVAKDELNKIKSNNSSWDENTEIPAFKPNEMKAKSFIKRLEFGTNLQFSKPNSQLPSIADIAGQAAYKFHQNGSFGVGASYKLGYGNLRRLSISHQGVGVRSFMDYRLKGKFYINGGFEYNYNAAFQTMDELRQFNSWQKSALIGLSRKYKISQKLKGNIIFLYDFLHNQHSPVSQPFLFRLGYNF